MVDGRRKNGVKSVRLCVYDLLNRKSRDNIVRHQVRSGQVRLFITFDIDAFELHLARNRVGEDAHTRRFEVHQHVPHTVA